MASLSLKAKPTFSARVPVPVPGGEPVLVEFIFKHRTRSQLQAFSASRDDASDTDSVLAMAEGWDLDAEFNAANVAELCENYIGAPSMVYLTYLQELAKSKTGN
jgi:Phage tail assembly chaperone